MRLLNALYVISLSNLTSHLNSLKSSENMVRCPVSLAQLIKMIKSIITDYFKPVSVIKE